MICTSVVALVGDRSRKADIAIPSISRSTVERLRSVDSERPCWEDRELYRSLWSLSGRRLICHCRSHENCHGDVLIEEFSKCFPDAYDRAADETVHPSPEILSFMSRLRKEPDSDDGSSPDEGVPHKFAGHRGHGKPSANWSRIHTAGDVRRPVIGISRSLGTCVPRLPEFSSLEAYRRLLHSFRRVLWYGDTFGLAGDGKVLECLFQLKRSRNLRVLFSH